MTADLFNVGFVGLGDTGWAHRTLDAGFALTAFDKREAAFRELADRGKRGGRIRHLTDVNDVVCICVVDDKQLHAVVHDARDGLHPGQTLIIHSSVMPATAGIDVGVIDTPVSGSRPPPMPGR